MAEIYKDSAGREITKTAYEAQQRANESNNLSPANPASTIDTTPITTPSDVFNVDKNSQTYKDLINSGKTDEWIQAKYSEAKSKYQKANPTKQSIDSNIPVQPPVEPKVESPVQPKQDTTQTSTTTTQPHPDYQDNSPERLTQIRTNLENIANSNPERFYNADTIKKTFDYDSRSQAQKDIFDEMIAKVNKVAIPDYWSSKTNDSIANDYINGTLKSIELTDLYKNDPTKYQEVQSLIAKKKLYKEANDTVSGQVQSVLDSFGLDTTAVTNTNYLTEYNKLVDTPEMTAANTAMATAKQEITTLDDQISNMEDTIKAQYEGTGMNQDVLDAIVADRTQALARKRDYATNTYNNNLAIANAIKADAEKKMSYLEKEQTQKQQEFANKMSALGFGVGLLSDLGTSTETDKNIGKTIDVGTAKNPKVLMWNTETQAYDIPVGGTSGGVSLGGSSSSSSSKGTSKLAGTELGNDMISRLNSIKKSLTEGLLSGASTYLGLATGFGQSASDLEYIKNNLTFDKLREAKKNGLTGTISDADMKLLATAASSLNPKNTPEGNINEINRLIGLLGGKIENTKKSSESTQASTSNSNTSNVSATAGALGGVSLGSIFKIVK